MKLFLLLITTMLYVSCVPDSTIVAPGQTSDAGTLPPPTPTPPSGDDNFGGGDSSGDDNYGKIPYYTFQSIIAHGGNSSTVVWSSATSVSPHIDDQNIFRTDATLKFRIIAKPSPGKGTDSLGRSCDYYAMNYSALKLRVGVRAQNSTNYSDIQTFDNLSLYQTSPTHTFRAPVTSGYFVVDVLGPEWDWYKVNYPDRGYPDWVPVFENDCIEFELQMVTDSTYDFN